MFTNGNINIGDSVEYVDYFGMIEKDQYALGHVNKWIVRRGTIHGAQLEGNWGMVSILYYVWHVASLKNIMIGEVNIGEPWSTTL